MRDDQRPHNPSDPGDRRDAFDDALDDLFGQEVPSESTGPDPAPVNAPAPQTSVDQESSPPQDFRAPEPSPPPFSPPLQRSSGPGIRGWTWRKAGCYTCLGFFGIIFACLVILFIIGLISGDPDAPGPAGHVWGVAGEVHGTFQDDQGGILAEPFLWPDGLLTSVRVVPKPE